MDELVVGTYEGFLLGYSLSYENEVSLVYMLGNRNFIIEHVIFGWSTLKLHSFAEKQV